MHSRMRRNLESDSDSESDAAAVRFEFSDTYMHDYDEPSGRRAAAWPTRSRSSRIL